MKIKRFFIGVLSVALLAGVFSAVQQIRLGDAATGLGTLGAGGVVWGLYVVGDGFFASVGLASLILASLLRVFQSPRLEPAAQNAVSLGIAGLLASVLCVMADLGRAQAALITLPLLGRARAPFFATFTLVAGASLVAAVVQWFLASRPGWTERFLENGGKTWRLLARGPQASAEAAFRRNQVNFWFGLSVLPVLLLALGILGRVFCHRAGRPQGLVHLETAAFMLSAGAAACSLVFVTAAAPARAILARTLSVLVALSALSVEACEFWGLRTSMAAARSHAQALLEGPYTFLFLTELAMFLVAGAVVAKRLWKGQGSAIWALSAACLTFFAVFIHRYLLLVSWQTDGLGLPWPRGEYQATGIEWGLLLGIAALAASLAWTLMVVGPSRGVTAGSQARVKWTRLWATGACLLAGGVAAIIGLGLSAGVGSGSYLDPVVTGGPLLFLGGLLLMIVAPAVYELLPER